MTNTETTSLEPTPIMPMLVPKDIAILEANQPVQGRHLAAVRKTLGLSREEFSDEIGIRANSIYRWEAGRVAIGNFRAILLACAYLAVLKGMNPQFVFVASETTTASAAD